MHCVGVYSSVSMQCNAMRSNVSFDRKTSRDAVVAIVSICIVLTQLINQLRENIKQYVPKKSLQT